MAKKSEDDGAWAKFLKSDDAMISLASWLKTASSSWDSVFRWLPRDMTLIADLTKGDTIEFYDSVVNVVRASAEQVEYLLSVEPKESAVEHLGGPLEVARHVTEVFCQVNPSGPDWVLKGPGVMKKAADAVKRFRAGQKR